jgi:hypothetical protein
MASRICAELAGWSEELVQWIRRSEGELVPWAIFTNYLQGTAGSTAWGVTLLGDVAHVVGLHALVADDVFLGTTGEQSSVLLSSARFR